MKKILLTHPYGPYVTAWGRNMFDLHDSRLSRGHGIFGSSAKMPVIGLHMIAENIRNPVTVMEFPNFDDFAEEVDKGYDYVGIQLKALYMPKVANMVRTIRERSPKTEIIIGGYGVMALDKSLPWDKEKHAEYIRKNAHHFCQEEGVGFMRKLLGDEPVNRPITQYHVPPSEFSLPKVAPVQIREPNILVSLGCPNACDFCATSAFFKHEKIPVAEPAQVYDFMKRHQQRIGAESLPFLLFDEDMFVDPTYARELGRLIRSDKKTWGLQYFTFGSIRGISQFEPEELRECGLFMVWIGVESGLVEEGKSQTGYEKRDGAKDPYTVFRELSSCGISTVGSMILGLDIHTPENILSDIDYFVKLRPTFYQISPIMPCPGTKLYDQMLAEGRLQDDSYYYENIHFWNDDLAQTKHFGKAEIKKYHTLIHQKLSLENGPPTIQLYENFLNAHENFKKSKSAFLRYQGERALPVLRGLAPVLGTIKDHAPSPKVKKRIADLEKRSRQVLGREPFAAMAFRKSVQTLLNLRFDFTDLAKARDSFPQFGLQKTYYNQPGQSEPTVQRGRSNGKKPIPFTKDTRRYAYGSLQINPSLF